MTDNKLKGGIALKKIIAVCAAVAVVSLLALWTALLPKTVKYTVKRDTPKAQNRENTLAVGGDEKESYTVKLSDGKIVAEADGRRVMEITVNPDMLTSYDVEMLTQGIDVENEPQLEILAQYLQS